jgi:hypothetical protein
MGITEVLDDQPSESIHERRSSTCLIRKAGDYVHFPATLIDSLCTLASIGCTNLFFVSMPIYVLACSSTGYGPSFYLTSQ